jgi:hypothetical protein
MGEWFPKKALCCLALQFYKLLCMHTLL